LVEFADLAMPVAKAEDLIGVFTFEDRNTPAVLPSMAVEQDVQLGD